MRVRWAAAAYAVMQCIALAACTEADVEGGAFDRTVETAESSRSTPEPTTPPTSAPTTTVGPVQQLVLDACAEPQRATQVGIQLRADLVYESPADEGARIDEALAYGAFLAQQAADADPTYDAFARAYAYWRDNSIAYAGDPIDPQLDDAIATIDDTCVAAGMHYGEDALEVPEGLYADTAERGRFDACRELIFGDDGTAYVQGERFDYSDCDRITMEALDEANHDDGYERSVELFFADVGGPLCWGEECHDQGDF